MDIVDMDMDMEAQTQFTLAVFETLFLSTAAVLNWWSWNPQGVLEAFPGGPGT